MIFVWLVQVVWATVSLLPVLFRAVSPPLPFRLGDRDTWICLCRRFRGVFVKVTWAGRLRRDGRVLLALSGVLGDAAAGAGAPIGDEKSTRIRRWRFFLLASWNLEVKAVFDRVFLIGGLTLWSRGAVLGRCNGWRCARERIFLLRSGWNSRTRSDCRLRSGTLTLSCRRSRDPDGFVFLRRGFRRRRPSSRAVARCRLARFLSVSFLASKWCNAAGRGLLSESSPGESVSARLWTNCRLAERSDWLLGTTWSFRRRSDTRCIGARTAIASGFSPSASEGFLGASSPVRRSRDGSRYSPAAATGRALPAPNPNRSRPYC